MYAGSEYILIVKQNNILSVYNQALLSANDLKSVSELRQLKQAIDEMISEKLSEVSHV